MEYFTMNNGLLIPAIGTGTNTFGKANANFMAEANGSFAEAKSAITAGYRLFDTAIAYRNESGIGKVIAESGIPRDEFFIITKIPPTDEFVKDKDAVRKAVASSLKNLRTDYIDLYLIHRPWEDDAGVIRTWNTLAELMDEGKLRSIGVSNFMVKDLQLLQRESKIKPAVNQVQCNPGEWNQKVIDYCLHNDILPMAWSPLKQVDAEYRAKLDKIARKHNKTWTQVLLRFDYQRGICVVPKSHNADHQKENLEIFDFCLDARDIADLGRG